MSQETPNFVFNDISDEYNIDFELHRAHPSLANSIRRLILSDVETIGFKTEPLEESDINIIQNTSSLHNEFLLHRIGMIPLYYQEVKRFNSDRYKFILNVTNDTSQIKDITTQDFQVFDTELNDGEGDFIDREDFFPKNPITKEYILITKLKPNLEGEGEKIHLEGKAMRASGKLNSRWQPTSCVVYFNKKDDIKVKEGLSQFLEKKRIEYGDTYEHNKENLIREFEISESERYYLTDDKLTPNVFNFNIESIGVIKSHVILSESLDILNFKLINLSKELNIVKQNSEGSRITVNNSETVMNAYDIDIPNENHTIGFLIQSYIDKYFDKSMVTFIGYFNPHPLKDNIVIRISTPENNRDIAIDTILKIISIIQKDLTSLKNDLNIKFGIKKTMSLKIGKKSK